MNKNGKQIIKDIAYHKNTEKCGYWTGIPRWDTQELYIKKSGCENMEELFSNLGDNCRWITADSSYRAFNGIYMFDPNPGKVRKSYSEPGIFADCEKISDIDKYPWPEINDINFTDKINEISAHKDNTIFSGFWSCFFHIIADFFGMQNYFIKMYTNPAVVYAVTERVIDFLEKANDMFLETTGSLVDVFFIGNDFGTQRGLLISPDCFCKFILPGLKRIINVAKKHGKKVMVHSCGAISEIIPYFIDIGVDILHPLQANAEGMQAERLVKKFGKNLAFCGGVDTQELLVKAKSEDVKKEVRRLKKVFGYQYIVSPSHEALLPNVPLENVIAMAQAAKE